MRNLVTGGAGFIGSHLVDELLRLGQEVFAVDDLSTGKIDNLSHVEGNKLRCFYETCADPVRMDEFVRSSDRVFHLAATVGVKKILESPVATISNNIGVTEVVLAAAAKHGKPVLVASTSEVYGKSGKLPFREDDDTVSGPTSKSRWAYAYSKAIDEFLALAYWKERGLPTVVARLFNTVGPRQSDRYGMVLPTFVRQALAGEPITVHGDGTQSRCFTHVHDVVRALVGLMDGKCFGGVYNVGASTEVQIGDLAMMVHRATDSRSDIRYVPYEAAYGEGFEDMQRRIPDTRKIREAIGWKPELSLEQIIGGVIDHERRGMRR